LNPVRASYLACACLFILGLILTLTTQQTHSALIILPLVVAAGIYTLSPQIMWWHWQRNPPDLPTGLAPLLERFDLYRRLDLEGKREFRRRTFLLKEATNLQGQAIEDIPADIYIMVAASAATVGFHRPEFLLDGYENVIFYRHYFPSPVHEVLHCSELHTEDKAIIWTLNVFLRSCIEPRKFLQLGLYEYGRALLSLEPDLRTRIEKASLTYAQIEQLSGFSEEKLKEFIGLEELDMAGLTMVLYFSHREEMQTLTPDTFAVMESEMGLLESIYS
jgi:hypothetical protein